ncbi:MAG TPA: TonB-dependent receptor [Chryseolinea sp.]|nr:TonB-dependent receptor [Chryseolinea sp.]
MNKHQSIQDAFIVIMRITLTQSLIMVVLSSLVSAAPSNGQGILDRKVSLNVRNTEIKSILTEIEKQTSVVFTYRPYLIKGSKKISLNVMDARLADVLGQLFSPSIAFLAMDDEEEIVLKPNSDKRSDDNVTITERVDIALAGKVLDESGEPLPGVNVVEKGTTNGTTTDASGRFKITVQEENSILVFSFIGYKALETRVGTQTELSVTLQADVTSLEEVVVVGYGTQEKVNLTGAVGVTSGEALKNRPIANVGEGLQGIVPNLNVNIRNGDPAEPIDFNVRGFESINGGQPLVLVDNVPMDLNRINPNDIESVSVLKDASAAAVYGARAAFGVILVTTKKGKGDRISISFGSEYALSKPIFLIDPVTDPHQFVLARNTASIRTNGAPAFDQDMIDGTRAWSENPTFENAWKVYDGDLRFYGYNNYVDRLITDFAPQLKYDMSISGATDKSSFYVSFGSLSKDGYLKNKAKNENFKRYNILLKGDFKIKEWLSADSRVLITTEKSDKPHFYNWDVNINTSARVDPINPIQFPDLPYYLQPGDHADFEQYIGMYFGSVNFLPYLENGGRQTWTRNDMVLTQGATLSPLKGLKIRGEFSANYRYRDFQDVQSKIDVIANQDLAAGLIVNNGFSGNDWINNESNNDQYYVLNTFADYTIDDKTNGHFFKAMVGFNQEWGRFQFIRAQAYGLINPAIPDIKATTGSQETYGAKEHTALRGAFYRLNYIFKDRYLLEANGRYDGTSRFPKDDRFGFFPSFSIGWRISNESFMAGTNNWLDNLKLRASYGELGNQLLFEPTVPPTPIYYPYIPTMASGNSPYMMSSGTRSPYVSAAGLVSPTLTWETVATTNFGLDFSMLGNKLDVSFDVYSRDTKDMLTEAVYPSILGTDAPKQNAADLRTKGWELAATWQSRINENWNYSITLALSDNKSEITKYDNPTGALPNPTDVNTEYYVGQTIGERWGFVTEGIFQSEAEIAEAANQSQLGANWRPGDIRYADLNGDGVISRGDNTLANPGDQKIIAIEAPRGNFGISGNIGWKNFSLNIFFQGVLKHDFWPPNDNWVAFYPFNAGHVENYYITDTWSEANRDAYFPAPHISTNTKQNVQPQSRYVQNGAYIRLKNLTLAYNLPTKVIDKVGMTNAQIYFAGMNMWETTKMRKPLDPEVRPTLTQEYYKQRSYSLGVRISF